MVSWSLCLDVQHKDSIKIYNEALVERHISLSNIPNATKNWNATKVQLYNLVRGDTKLCKHSIKWNGSRVWVCAFHSVSKTFSFLWCTKGVGSQGWSSTTLLQVSNMISFSFIAHHQGGSYLMAFKAAQWRRRAWEAWGLPGMRKSLRRLSLLATTAPHNTHRHVHV